MARKANLLQMYGECEGKCYSGEGTGFRCEKLDPETGKRCSLNSRHLLNGYHDYESRHVHCEANKEGTMNIRHAVVMWVHDEDYCKKTRSARSIRSL